MYNMSLVNFTNPQLMVKSTSDILCMGILEESMHIVIFFILYGSMLIAQQPQSKALVYSTMFAAILSVLMLSMQWVNGYYVFVWWAMYAVSLLVAWMTSE